MNKQQLIVAGLLAFSPFAGAQALKPGLWEVTQKTQLGGGQMDAMAQMQKELANMPPDQRKMVEQMMARQGVGTGGGGGMSMKMCMTKEMVERNEVTQPQGDCKTTVQPRTGNTMKMSFSCANPPSTGEGQMTFTSPEAYSMTMSVSTKVQGQYQKTSMDSSARWLSPECGSIRPVK